MGCFGCSKWPLRRYFRLLWWLLCVLTFIALPVTIWEFQKEDYNIHYQAWFIGGMFVILSMPISIYEIALHTEYYTQPRLQKHVIRILWMVPIYAVDAWFALRFRSAREYLDPIRECYEAFVIYSFFAYLMAYLEDSLGDLNEYLSHKPQMQHVRPLRLILRPWDMGTRFLWECKKGVLNYVILRPVCTGLAFITDMFGRYGQGHIDFSKSYVYLAAVTNFSQLWALYCLIMLYTAMHEELAPIRPLSKFICIKAVVFVTFWQSVTIAILVAAGVIKPGAGGWTTYDKADIAAGIQDFLICIEMFIAALAHAYAFPPRDYMTPGMATKGFFSNVRYMFDLRDVVGDVGLVVEDHVSNATSAVVKVPQRAVKGAVKQTKKLIKGATGSGPKGSGRLLAEEEEEASKAALLGSIPNSSGGAGAGASAASSGRTTHAHAHAPTWQEMQAGATHTAAAPGAGAGTGTGLTALLSSALSGGVSGAGTPSGAQGAASSEYFDEDDLDEYGDLEAAHSGGSMGVPLVAVGGHTGRASGSNHSRGGGGGGSRSGSLRGAGGSGGSSGGRGGGLVAGMAEAAALLAPPPPGAEGMDALGAYERLPPPARRTHHE